MKYNWLEKQNSNSTPGAKLVFTGDFCPIRRFEKKFLAKPLDSVIDTSLLSVFRNADLTTINLESVLTDSDDFQVPGYGLKASPQMAKVLKNIGVDVTTLANNHIRDVKSKGVVDTIKKLESININTTGAGKNIDESYQPWIGNINGIKVGIYAIAEKEDNIASATRAGAASFEPEKLKDQIAQLKDKVDILIVSIHAGHEFLLTPSPRIVKAYHSAIDFGADSVIGHHPHVAQGIEIYRGKPIFYSLGNFCFDSDYVAAYPYWDKGFLVELGINKKEVCKIEILPYHIKQDGRVNVMDEACGNEFISHLQNLSGQFSNPDKIIDSWKEQVYERFDNELYSMWQNIGNKLCEDTTSKTALQLRNLLTCPTHHEFFDAAFTELARRRGYKKQ